MKLITIAQECPKCGVLQEVHAEPGDIERWQGGELIQNALSYLSVQERETLISGFCPTCWDDLFKEDK